MAAVYVRTNEDGRKTHWFIATVVGAMLPFIKVCASVQPLGCDEYWGQRSIIS